jgi:hypothetical protein
MNPNIVIKIYREGEFLIFPKGNLYNTWSLPVLLMISGSGVSSKLPDSKKKHIDCREESGDDVSLG